MQKFIILIALLVLFFQGFSQKPKDGTYTYSVAFDEWGGKSLGATCIVKIKGDSITVINNGSLTGNKGDIMDQGIIMKHRKTGKWIIGRSPKDKNAIDFGGCGDGPSVIDFKNKKWWTC